MRAWQSGISGKTSSKRLAGFALLGVGTLSRVFVLVLAYIAPAISAQASEIAIKASDPFFWLGAGLLGIGIFEGLGVKYGGKNGG